MKKALSLTLALAVCIALMSGALVPLTALAYGDDADASAEIGIYRRMDA